MRMPVFRNLAFFPDPLPRLGPAQMAVDQALLELASVPVLRVYRWAAPAVTFGYSHSYQAVLASCPGLPLVRRWTGGGVVPHTGDWTFALICPRDIEVAHLPPDETYRLIHTALAEALACLGLAARLVAASEVLPGPHCFAAPALSDVFDSAGRKICGGAQRRTRHGFLHQGSLQHCPVPPDFGSTFASALAEEVTNFSPPESLESRTAHLVQERYATPEWLKKIP